MNKKTEKCWNERLNALMKKKGFSQVEFANAMNEKYRTHLDEKFSQKSVSRWLHVGDKNGKNGRIGFPKYETMLLIADFFQVDVGYLTGETDSKRFDLECTSKYIGIDGHAVEIIRNFALEPFQVKYENLINAATLNQFFSSKHIIDFLDSLVWIYGIASKDITIRKKAVDKWYENVPLNISKDKFGEEYIDYDESIELENAVYELEDLTQKYDYACFKIYKEILLIIDDVFPKPCLKEE